jgi:hypothetical protein
MRKEEGTELINSESLNKKRGKRQDAISSSIKARRAFVYQLTAILLSRLKTQGMDQFHLNHLQAEARITVRFL